MLDAVKDYLERKTFSIRAYVCSIIQLLCGLAFIGIVVYLSVKETAKFNCVVDPKSAASYKTDVERRCNNRYQHKYNSPLPFYGFVSLCFWFPIIIGVIYSLAVRSRVEDINTVSTDESQTNPATENQQQNRSCHVFYFYFFHLVIRLVFGLLFSVLQYVVFFPNGFDFKFICNLPTAEIASKITKNSSASRQLNSTSIMCENSTASEKKLWAGIVCALNTIFALIIFVEVIYLCLRFPRNLKFYSGVGRIYDTEFVTVYFSRKEYRRVGTELTNFECIDLYRKRVLKESRTPDITYGPKTGLDELFIDVVIHTGQATHKFPDNMKRHEIFDVYRKVPPRSLQLEKVKDLFYGNRDTDWESPRKILVVGRPGIGKTVLTRKIMRDWANKIDQFYSGMIAFYFKFRWFNLPKWKNLTLKKFLCFGTGLSDEQFEGIFGDIIKNSQKALLIFDGLDEFDGKFEDYRDHLPHQNNPDIGMPGISLFIKLIFDHFLPGATVLVTTRPTANEFYSNFRVDRNVEIIGFTKAKTKDYVRKFCENHDRSDFEQKIWNHITSSSDLLNLCYIPVNCFIISTVLFGCLRDASDETAVLPTTLTELYQAAIEHFDGHHYRKGDELSSKEAIKKLRLLAYNGIVNGQLVFNKELVDEEMRRSGLLNNLSNPIFPIQTQFCFIHLTIQEFLAAEHVTETQSPEEIKNVISSNIKDGKWHLVLQFIAGLLGQKRKKFKKEYQRYKDCALAFTESFNVDNNGKLDLSRNYSSVLAIKCLWEVGDESVVKEACEGTAMNDVVGLSTGISYHPLTLELSPSQWAAVVFVCKHMKNLTNMKFIFSSTSLVEECYVEFNKLLQQRCIKELFLYLIGPSEVKNNIPLGRVFKALLESKCMLNHRHNMLTQLSLHSFCNTHESLSILLDFFRHRHATCLEELRLCGSYLSPSEITKICEVFDIELCPELTRLDLTDNEILDEGVRVLCTALIKCHQLKLTELHLCQCSLTDQCIPSLCELFKDEHCKLTDLDISYNDIGDEVVRMLCEDVLTKEHNKLAKLDVDFCSLTDQCIPWLRKALLDKHCVLHKLTLTGNFFTEEGMMSLHKLATYEDCRARGLTVLID